MTAPRPLLTGARSAWPDTYTPAEAKAWISAMDATEGVLFEAGAIDEFGFITPASRAPADPEVLERAIHLIGNYLWNEDGESEDWLIEAHDILRAALPPKEPA